MGAEDFIPEGEVPARAEAPAEAPPAPRLRWPPLALGLMLLPAVLLLWFGGLETISRGAHALAFPCQLDREEGFLLDQATRIARGEQIYRPIDDYPFVASTYPPVYPLAFAAAVAVTKPVLPAGRALVLLAALVVLAVLANVTLRAGPGVAPAFLAMGLLLANWEVHEWIAFARVDFPALAFGLAGLATATMSRRWGWQVLAGLLFVVAFFTKQTQVVAPAAVVLAMLLRREHARAFALSGIVAAGVLGGIAALSAATAGEFWRHTIVYNANDFVPGQIETWLRHLWRFSSIKLVAGVVVLAVLPWLARLARASGDEDASRRPADITAVAAIYTLLAGLTLLSTGKAGAAGNYLIEFQAALALLLATGLGRVQALLAAGAGPRGRLLALGAAVAALLAAQGAWYAARGRQMLSPPPQFADQVRVAERIIHESVLLRVTETEGDILTVYPVFATYANRPVLLQPFILSQLAREGKWDQSPLVADIEARRFALVITRTDFRREGHNPDFTAEMIRALRENYRLDDLIGPFFLFVPRDVPEAPGNQVRLIRSIASAPLALNTTRPPAYV